MWPSARMCTVTGPSAASRAISVESSTETASAGILATPSSYSSAPVCGVRRLWAVTDRISTASAPYLAARDGPRPRYCTVSP